MSTIVKKSLKVGKYVSKEHVDTVVRTYKQERWKYSTERLGKPDSLSAWWSVEELEQYLETAKKHGADGVRFYFAAYPENFTEKPEFAGRQSLVMVATKNIPGGDGSNNKDLYVRNGKFSGLLAYNMGSICPPICAQPAGPTTPSVGITIVDQGEKGLTVI